LWSVVSSQRGKAEQYIKEGKNAIQWTRLSCRKFRDNEVRLQLHALAYNLANFMRTLALRELGIPYVPLGGEVGLISSGAGAGLAILDWIETEGCRLSTTEGHEKIRRDQ
jgi:hypothetical protein